MSIAERCADVRERIEDSETTTRVVSATKSVGKIGGDVTGFLSFQAGRLFRPFNRFAKGQWAAYQASLSKED